MNKLHEKVLDEDNKSLVNENFFKSSYILILYGYRSIRSYSVDSVINDWILLKNVQYSVLCSEFILYNFDLLLRVFYLGPFRFCEKWKKIWKNWYFYNTHRADEAFRMPGLFHGGQAVITDGLGAGHTFWRHVSEIAGLTTGPVLLDVEGLDSDIFVAVCTIQAAEVPKATECAHFNRWLCKQQIKTHNCLDFRLSICGREKTRYIHSQWNIIFEPLFCTNKPVINRPVNQSINRPVNQSINQSTSQSINQSINQSSGRSTV